MKYAGIIKNDITAMPGVCVTVYLQGCPNHCPGCHNPQTWDFDGGKEFTTNTMANIMTALTANGIHRDLCIQGGEPLCLENQFLTLFIIEQIKEKFSDIKIGIWTGYTLQNIPKSRHLDQILELTDVIIDGPYIEAERDITIPMRGSRNQRILYKGKDF